MLHPSWPGALAAPLGSVHQNRRHDAGKQRGETDRPHRSPQPPVRRLRQSHRTGSTRARPWPSRRTRLPPGETRALAPSARCASSGGSSWLPPYGGGRHPFSRCRGRRPDPSGGREIGGLVHGRLASAMFDQHAHTISTLDAARSWFVVVALWLYRPCRAE